MSRVTATADSQMHMPIRSRAESKEKALRNICLPKPQTATMAMGWPGCWHWPLGTRCENRLCCGCDCEEGVGDTASV